MITTLFCHMDDFYESFKSHAESGQLPLKGAKSFNSRLYPSEIMTIVVYFHLSHYRNFKAYYKFLQNHLHKAFPNLVSYNRFVELIPSVLVPLTRFLDTQMGQVTGLSFVDSTHVKVCHNKRIKQNKVFKGLAKRGKSTMGWFFGFKLHLVINDKGELLAFYLSPGNVDDRNEKVMKHLTQRLLGKLFGDKGYLSQKLFEELFDKGIQLITNVRKNMKNRLMELQDKILLRKRSLIESVNDELKNICHIQHSRHRSPTNWLVNLVAGLVAYSFFPKKPSLKFDNALLNEAILGV